MAYVKGNLMGVLALQQVVDANADDSHLHRELRGELPILCRQELKQRQRQAEPWGEGRRDRIRRQSTMTKMQRNGGMTKMEGNGGIRVLSR